MTSVNTNYGALVALQNLNMTTRSLEEVQSRLNTGQKVASARDNGAVWAIAESQRTRVEALSSVRDGIDRAKSAIDVGVAAGEDINNLLKQMRDKAVEAQAAGLSDDDRAKLQTDFDALRKQIDQIANSASYNGINLVNGTNVGSKALGVLTTDLNSASGGVAASGEFVRGAAADGTVAGEFDLDTVITGAGFGGGTGAGFTAGDEFRITLTDSATEFIIDIEAGDTVEDFINKVNNATGGNFTATFDEANGQIVYTSDEEFSLDITDAGGAGNSAAAEEVQEIFIGSVAAVGNAQNSITYVAGGGFQASGGGNDPPPATTSLLSATGIGVADDDVLQFEFAGDDEDLAATGDNTTVSITLDADWTLDRLIQEVSTQTNGRVSAVYNGETGVLTFRSDEEFSIDAGGNAFLGDGETAIEVPSSGASSSTGSGSIQVVGADFRLGSGALSQVTTALDISTTGGAATAVAALDNALSNVRTQLATFGSQSTALTTQKDFLQKLSDTLEKSIGQLVDADLARESARLQSLQIKQQLGTQALSIANQAPSLVLSLFR